MCLAQGQQHSDASEARTRNPLVSIQALYQWATALPIFSDLSAKVTFKKIETLKKQQNFEG